MSVVKRFFVATFWAVVACSGREPRATSRSSQPAGDSGAASSRVTLQVPASQAGRLVLAASELSFIPCGSDARIRLQDMPNGDGAALVREFRGGNGEIPALVRMSESRLVEIRFAAPEGPDCGRLAAPVVVEARGNEPFWSVEVYGDSARLRVPLTPGGMVFNRGSWRQLTGGQWAYEARRGQSGSEEFLVLELTETPCSDSMSGARYAFRAALIRDGNPARGCAVEGLLATAK